MVLRAVVAIETQLVQRAFTLDNGEKGLFVSSCQQLFWEGLLQ